MTIHIHIPEVEITIPPFGMSEEQKFMVRGLTIVDLGVLLNKYGAEMSLLYGKYVKGDLKLTEGQEREALAILMQRTPALLAEAISLVTDKVVKPEIALRLPLSVQVDILRAIGKTTFVGDNALGKFLGVVTELMEGITQTTQTLTTPTPRPSTNGTGSTASS